MGRYAFTLMVCASSFFASAWAHAQSDSKSNKQGGDDSKITLERLFPKESFFGPSARSPEFSHDGRFAAYLYRTFDERRHGNDLWIYDFKTGENTRVTNLALMTEFQRTAHIVKQDRLAKHKASKDADEKSESGGKKSSDSDKDDDEDEKGADDDDGADEERQKTAEEIEAENKIVNSVSKEDAEDKFAPRYSGIAGFQWHPTDNSLLVFSEGDVYHIADVQKPELKRLTRTSARESQVDFLPDGSGYTYNVDNSVYRLQFDSHLVEQLNPRLGADQELSSYSISPDGKKLVIVARTGDRGSAQGGRKVEHHSVPGSFCESRFDITNSLRRRGEAGRCVRLSV